MKTFKLEFQDNNQNELTTKTVECFDRNEAEKLAETYFANCMINDCVAVIVLD